MSREKKILNDYIVIFYKSVLCSLNVQNNKLGKFKR